jgi:GntR family phosphonate transport system transcriptional regulator
MSAGSTPIYRRIAEILRTEITESLQAGRQIESEVRLAERFHVNRHTVRRAIDELVSEGLLERKHGVGLFVRERPFDYELHAETRLSTNLAQHGITGKREFIRKFTETCGESVGTRLGLPLGARVICLEYLIVANDRSLSLATHYFEEKRFRAIYERYDPGGSLHHFIRETYGIEMKRVSSHVFASLPSEQDASLLRIPRTLPILNVKSLNQDRKSGEPSEFVISRFRSDRIELSVHF